MVANLDTQKDAIEPKPEVKGEAASTVASDQWKQMQAGAKPPRDAGKAESGAQSLTFDNSIYQGLTNSNSAKALGQEISGIDSSDPKNKTLDKSGVANTETILANAKYDMNDRLRAADVLASNGISQVKGADGQIYTISAGETRGLSSGKTIQLSTLGSDGKAAVIASGQVDENGEVSNLNGNRTRGIDIKDKNTADDTKPTKPIFDPNLTAEQKLQEADKMYQRGEKHFTGPNGEKYDISESNVGGRKVISVHLNDGHSSKPVLRGVIEKDGSVSKQKDSKGHDVDTQSDWAKKHGADIALLKKPEPKPEPNPNPNPSPDKGDGKDGKNDGKDGKGDGKDGQDKPHDQTEEQKALDAEREKLKHNAEKLESSPNKDKFLKDMEAFEKRAKESNMAPSEVTETYKQMNRLLEADKGAVGAHERQLAAESFMHHAADPTNIDQGYHNTCNVTTIAERTMTRHPSKVAEMVATSAIDGKWIAPDGKEIKLKPESLQPGREEGTFPPARDGDRSYATQLMNTAMVNDALQRRMPPEYYSSGRPTATNRTGETVTYEDGSPKGDGAYHGIHLVDMTKVEKRLTGESNFAISSKTIHEQEDVARVGSTEELKGQLQAMKDAGKLPAVIQVDVNDPIFGGTGDPATKGKWHVVSVTGYDAATGKVTISNQWGQANDITADVNNVYRSMT